jgi:hypothetical protein
MGGNVPLRHGQAVPSSDNVQSAVLIPDGNKVIASGTYDGVYRVSRGTVVGGLVELSVRTGRPLWTLLAQRAAYSADRVTRADTSPRPAW